MRAGTQRGIEREIVGSGFQVRQPGGGIHERAAVVAHFVGLGVENHQLAVSLLECQVNGLGKAFGVLGPHFEAVHHELHAVVDISVQLHAEGDFAQLAIDAHVDISLLAQVLKQVLVVSLAVLDQWRQDIDASPVVALENQAQDLVDGVFHHLLPREVGIGVGSTCIQQPEVVIYLGRRAHGAARVAVHGLLPYRDNGTQAGNLVHVGTFQHAEHVAGIGRESFQVTPLPLGKHRVKCQRRLAAATQAGDDGELVVGNLHVDVLQVVNLGTEHLDAFCFLPVKFHDLVLCLWA